MAKGIYEVFAPAWPDHLIKVSYQANWLNAGQWHVELRCDARLPVSTTRYRSIFVPQSDFADEAAIKEGMGCLNRKAVYVKRIYRLHEIRLAKFHEGKELKLIKYSARRKTDRERHVPCARAD